MSNNSTANKTVHNNKTTALAAANKTLKANVSHKSNAAKNGTANATNLAQTNKSKISFASGEDSPPVVSRIMLAE